MCSLMFSQQFKKADKNSIESIFFIDLYIMYLSLFPRDTLP